MYCAFDERPASDWARAARELLVPREATEEEHKAAVCEALRSMLLALARGGDSRRPAPSSSAAVSFGSAATTAPIPIASEAGEARGGVGGGSGGRGGGWGTGEGEGGVPTLAPALRHPPFATRAGATALRMARRR